MQKIVDIVVTACLLVAAAAFWLLGGAQYLPMLSGTLPVGEEGLATHFICFITAIVSLFLFVCRVIKGFLSEGKKDESIGDGPAGISQFLARQSIWVKDWCRYSHNKDKMSAYLWVTGITVALSAIGVLVGYPFQWVLTFHLPLGLLLGEILVGLCWPLISSKNNWKKIIKRMRKTVQKQMPSAQAQQEYFTDYFDADGQWQLVEKGKDTMTRVTVGARYWTYMTQYGVIHIVDSNQLERIEIYDEVITVRVNHVRTYTRHYPAEFFARNENPKKRSIGRYSFNSRDTLDAFVRLVQARTDGRITVEDVGTKRL